MEIRDIIRRTGLLLMIYLVLLVALIPILEAMHPRTSIPLAEILMAGAILSIGPFLYAFVARRSAYFHEDTIAGLTHEMKTPLATIQSALEIINSATPLSTSSTDDYLQMIRSNATRLQGFVDSLIHVFGSEQSKSALTRQEVDVRQLCARSLESIRILANMKQTELVCDLPSTPILIFADPTKLEHVLSNLLSNAIKFTTQGCVTLRLQRLDKEINISVRDTGIGLTSEEITCVFDRFYQGKAGKQKKGTGIGLTLAKQWVVAHGGRIWAESEGEGKGTMVTFTLPSN
jgi:signal transduction histidine kinase